MNGVWVILTNSLGCELDRQFVAQPDGQDIDDEIGCERVSAAVTDMISVGLRAGDTISIVEGWSEQ